MRSRRDSPPFLRTVTSKGQITIPAALVRSLHLRRGDQFEVSVPNDDPGSIALQLLGPKPRRHRGKEEDSR